MFPFLHQIYSYHVGVQTVDCKIKLHVTNNKFNSLMTKISVKIKDNKYHYIPAHNLALVIRVLLTICFLRNDSKLIPGEHWGKD